MPTEPLIKDLLKRAPGSISYGNIWLYRHMPDSRLGEIVDKPCKTNAPVVIICAKGTIELSCNFRQITMTGNTVFVSQPHNILQARSSRDAEGYVLLMEDTSISDYTIDPKHIPELLDKAYTSPLICISEDECRRVCDALDALFRFIEEKSETPFKSSIIRSATNTFFYILVDTLYTHIPNIEYELKTIKREKEHFNTFMKLLSENYLKEREVRFYADQMNLTPRYLTTIIRKVSGCTVSEWIYKFIIKDAKYLLKNSYMTVQQIAYELNFPNQSFFGKFFKKHTGMSPGTYRAGKDED